MFQTIIIVGNVGRDPEMRYTPSGVPVTSFNMATNRQYNNSKGEMTKETTWFRITCWSKLAETVNDYIKKGNKVLVEGRLVSDPATGGPRIFTRSDGTSAASFEVNAQIVRNLSSRSESGENAQAANSSPAGTSENTSAASSGSSPLGYKEYNEPPVDEDDIPF